MSKNNQDQLRPLTLDQFVTGLFVTAKANGRRSFRADGPVLVAGVVTAAQSLAESGRDVGISGPVELPSDCAASDGPVQDVVVDAILRMVERQTLTFEPPGRGTGRLEVALSAGECDLLVDQLPGGPGVWEQAAAAFVSVFAVAPAEQPVGPDKDVSCGAEVG